MLLFIVLIVGFCLADQTIYPPLTGKFFYSDLEYDPTTGFQSLTLYKDDGSDFYNLLVTPNDYYMSLYLTWCQTCNADQKRYRLTNTGKRLNKLQVSESFLIYSQQNLQPMIFFGEQLGDTFDIQFKEYKRTVKFEMDFLGISTE